VRGGGETRKKGDAMRRRGTRKARDICTPWAMRARRRRRGLGRRGWKPMWEGEML